MTTLALLTAGCNPLIAKAAGEIVLQIGSEIAVEAGSEFLKKIFSSDDADGDATLIVSYTNATGEGVGTNYAIAGASRVTTANVTIRDVSGEIHIVGDGNGIAVTAAAGATGKIAISLGDGAAARAGNDSDGDDQAATIDGILGWSGRSRSALFDALDDLGACRNTGGATAALRGVADGRARQIDALDEIEVSALPDGDALRDTLVRALGYSLKADRAFVRWGESGCEKDGNHADAMDYSRSATATKTRFVNRWNPIARDHGLPAYRETEI